MYTFPGFNERNILDHEGASINSSFVFYPFSVWIESAPNQNAIYEQSLLQRLLGQEVTSRGVVNSQVFIMLEEK